MRIRGLRLRGQNDKNLAIFGHFRKVEMFLNGQNDTFSGGQNDKNFFVLLDAYDSNYKINSNNIIINIYLYYNNYLGIVLMSCSNLLLP